MKTRGNTPAVVASVTPSPPAGNGFQTRHIALLLAAITLLLFLPVRQFEFLGYDDNLFVTENRMVLDGLSAEGLKWAFTTEGADYWRPLSWMSHMVDVELFGLDAGAHHLVSLMIHCVNAALLFLVLARMTGRRWPSALVAALFAWHPLHLESVAWVAERKDVLCAFFWFLTMGAYVRYVEQPSRTRYAQVLVCFFLGVMSKPMIVTLPFALLLLDFWPLGRLWLPGENRAIAKPATPWRRVLAEKIPLLLLAVAVSVVTYFNAQKVGSVWAEEALSLTHRVSNALVAYTAYLEKMVWPTNLAILYPHPGQWPTGRVAVAALVVLSMTAWALSVARRFPFFVTGWFWYLGTLVPVIGFIQAGGQAMADRYTYLPLIGIFIAVTWSLAHGISGTKHERPLAIGLATAVLLACLVTTHLQLQHWRNDLTIFGHAITVTKGNFIILNNLGNALVRHERFAEAEQYLQAAMRLQPTNTVVLYNFGLAAAKQGRTNEAANYYQKVLQIKPEDAGAHLGLANLLADVGQIGEAEKHYRTVLKTDPDNPVAHYNLASLLNDLGKKNEATEHYAASLRRSPNNAQAHYNLANLLVDQNHPVEAADHFAAAISLQPNYPQAHHNLGALLMMQGRNQEALLHFANALKWKPDMIEAHANLATAFARLGRQAEAQQHFAEVQRLQKNLRSQAP